MAERFQRSAQRILTTHTGSLPRPLDLDGLMISFGAGELAEYERLWERVASATCEVVKQQARAGVDVLGDGEFGKASYVGYVKDRLAGFDGPPRTTARSLRGKDEFPDWPRNPLRAQFPTCNGPVTWRGPTGVQRDIANLKTALSGTTYVDAFMTAASPGVVDTFMQTTYYASDRDYLMAVAEAMKPEYRAIVDAGLVLQLDCPDLAMAFGSRFSNLDLPEFQQIAEMHVEVLNFAIAGLPRDRLRLHLCWGNYEGPHNYDVPLQDVIRIVLQAQVGALSFEAANPRHEHEWKIFRDISLPAGMILIPGVINTCTSYVEHPQLVAQRIVRFANVVGRENVMAGTDCGLGAVGARWLAPSIAWKKAESLAEGAALASKELWPK